MVLRHKNGLAADTRVFLCNRPTQGGGLKRQLDKVLPAMDGKTCFMLRASDFPPNRKNQTAQAFRKFRDGGGRQILVPIPEWERMMMVREFYNRHRHDPGFATWFAGAKLLSKLPPMIQLLASRPHGLWAAEAGERRQRSIAHGAWRPLRDATAASTRRMHEPVPAEAAPAARRTSCRCRSSSTRTACRDRASWRAASFRPTRAR